MKAENLSTGGQPLQEAVAVLQAMADPNRLHILDLLMQSDACNCELNERLGLPPNLLSYHLGALRRAGLVCSRRDVKDGRWIYYAASKETVTRWREWFQEFLDPARIRERPVLCARPESPAQPAGGPEGQQTGDI